MSVPDSLRDSRAWYDRWHAANLDEAPRDFAEYLRLASLEDPGGGRRWLDVGSGPGYMVDVVAARGWRAVGVDLSLIALSRARERAPGSRFVGAEGGRLPFPDGTFEAASALGTLEHFPDPAQGAAELGRVLKASGRALIVVPNRGFLPWRFGGAPGTEQRDNIELLLPLSGWKALLAEAGLEVVGVRKDPWHTKARSRILRTAYRAINAALPPTWNYQFLLSCRKAPG